MYCETNKKIKNYRNSTLQFSQPAKYRLVVHSDCYWKVENLRASGLYFLLQSPGPLICPLQQKFLVVKSVHQKQKRKLTKKYKSIKRK